MISTSRPESLSAARRLLRGFAGAPDTRRQAQQFYSVLIHGEGWSRAEQELIVSLGTWLGERPGLNELKKRCDEIFDKLT